MAIHGSIQGFIPAASSLFFMSRRSENFNLVINMNMISGRSYSGKHGAGGDCFAVQCKLAAGLEPQLSIPIRRSANYEPPVWSYDYIQSLTNDYLEESYDKQASKLKAQVTKMIELFVDPLYSLEQIDIFQRLGISYHFKNDIDKILKNLNEKNHKVNDAWKENNLCATTLKFRLMRQHGYNISQEIFNSFMDEQGNFKKYLKNDIKGLLSLYEASYLLVEGETIMEKARNFTTKHLREYVKQNNNDLSMLVSHALELPLHWRVPIIEARWFIDYYEKKQDMNPIVLELAKLDFNMVQAVYKEDLKQESRWWKNIDFENKLIFSRSRLVESFLWSIGITFEPQFRYYRQMVTKVISLVTTIDDIYDIYGTLDELKLFTDIVKRWDINALDQLPNYMKICFLGLYNSINEISFDVMKKHEINIIPHLREAWAELCESYLLEANWFASKYKPSLEEYMENAWISVGGAIVLKHVYILTKAINSKVLNHLNEYHDMIRWSSTIVRLTDDLGTSLMELERGDIPKSIQCYMHDTGASEEDAREHIRFLVDEMWKQMNKDKITHPRLHSNTYNDFTMNLARIALCMYKLGDSYGDGYDVEDYVLSILVQPIYNI